MKVGSREKLNSAVFNELTMCDWLFVSQVYR